MGDFFRFFVFKWVVMIHYAILEYPSRKNLTLLNISNTSNTL